MTTAVSELAMHICAKRACELLAYPRGRYCQRRQQPVPCLC